MSLQASRADRIVSEGGMDSVGKPMSSWATREPFRCVPLVNLRGSPQLARWSGRVYSEMEEPLVGSYAGAAIIIVDGYFCAPASSSHPNGLQVPLSDMLGAMTLSAAKWKQTGESLLLLGCCPRTQGSCCTAAHRQFVQHRYCCLDAQAAVDARVLVNSTLRTAGLINSSVRVQDAIAEMAAASTADMVAATDSQYVRRMLVIVNPAGGAGEALQKFNSHSRKMLAMAMVHLTVVVTTRPGHATDVARAMSLEGLDGLVVVGGDGLMHEALTGLCQRADAKEALRVPLGHIPGGSGNGFCESVCAASGEPLPAGFISATWIIAKGQSRPLNVARVWGQAGWSLPSMLSMEWAVMADVDIESEACRCLGSTRFIVAAAMRVLCCLRKYSGTLHILEASNASGSGTVDDFLQIDRAAVVPPFHKPVGPKWLTLEGDFSCVWVCNTSHMAPTAAVAPNTQLNDGLFHIIVIRDVNRCSLGMALLAMDEGGQEHLDHSCVQMYKARAYRLEPREGSAGRVVVDGELLSDQGNYDMVQSEMFSSVAQVFGTPHRNFDSNKQNW